MKSNVSFLWQRVWLKVSSPVLLLLIIAGLWLLSFIIFDNLLAWNIIISAYLSFFISVLGAELSLLWAKQYLRTRRVTTIKNTSAMLSPFYVPVKHDPDSFSRIIGMESTIEVLKDAFELPYKHPELIKSYGLKVGNGLLLYGPPGTAKTAVIRAAASYFRLNFFLISASAVMSERVGSSEKAIREVFATARANAPSLIFMDEIDVLARRRDGQHLNRPSDLALNSLLTELDGFIPREGVFVVGATNRKDVLDEAILRPGRFDSEVEVKLPDRKGRADLFRFFSRNMPVERDLAWEKLADYTDGYSGANIENCVHTAAKFALKRSLSRGGVVEPIVLGDFIRAIG